MRSAKENSMWYVGDTKRYCNRTEGGGHWMYPEWRISRKVRPTRSVADKSSFGNPGNGIPCNLRFRRRKADPPKNESGTAGTAPHLGWSDRSVSSGNGCCIAAKIISKSELWRFASWLDLTDTICTLEHRNDIVHASYLEGTITLNDKRQGWPDVQCVLYRCSFRTDKLQIQVTR